MLTLQNSAFSLDISVLLKDSNYLNDWKVSENKKKCHVIAFRLSSEILKSVYEDQLPKEFSTLENHLDETVFKIPRAKLINSFIENLDVYLNETKFITEELLKIKIRELIFLLIENDVDFKKILSSLFKKRNYDFNEVIKNNLYENLRLYEIAFLCNLSLSSFQRKFKEIYNSSPSKYINKKRIEKAKELIDQNEMRIAEIGYSVGFESPSHFSKAFSRICGKSPMQYKNDFNFFEI